MLMCFRQIEELQDELSDLGRQIAVTDGNLRIFLRSLIDIKCRENQFKKETTEIIFVCVSGTSEFTRRL